MSAREPIRSALITRAPVRSVTAVQNAGPSSPCSWTYVRPTLPAIRTTSSSVGFTNTPTGSTLRRSARAMPAATASSQRRLEPGQKLNPIAHTSSEAACSASSGRVMPQIFTWAIRPTNLASRHGGGALVQGYRHVTARLVAQHRQLHRVARRVAVDVEHQLGERLRGLAVDLLHHVPDP